MGDEAPDSNVSTTQSTTNNRELNTKHLHEKAYYRGYKDFIHGKLDDPYRKYSLYSKEWQRGQNAAYFVNLRMLHNGSLIRNFHRKKAAKKAQTLSVKASITA